MIPQILHLYWGRNRPLSYLRYLTYATFAKANPKWRIRIWTTDKPTMRDTWATGEQSGDRDVADCFGMLPTPEVFDFEARGFAVTASEVHKSDFARWCLLSEIGGWWSDFDIYYARPMTTMQTGVPFVFDAHTVVCAHRWHSIGFLGAAPESPLYATAAYLARLKYDPTQYQCLGRALLDKIMPPPIVSGCGVVNLPEDVVYPVRASPKRDIKRLQRRLGFPAGCVGVHWFAGHPDSAAIERSTTPGTLPPFA